MRRIAEHDGENRADDERREFVLSERRALEEYARCGNGAEGERIVEQELQGVNDIGVLKSLQEPVHDADEHAATGAEHGAVKHERQQTGECDGAALRQFEQTDIRERERHCYRNRAVNHRFRIVDIAFFADCVYGDENQQHHDHADDKTVLLEVIVIITVVDDVIVEITREHDHERDEAACHAQTRDDRRHFDEEFAEHGRHAHEAGADERDEHQGENGGEIIHCTAARLHIVEGCRGKQRGGYDRHAEHGAYADLGKVFEAVFPVLVQQQRDKSESENERDDGVQHRKAHFLNENIEIHLLPPCVFSGQQKTPRLQGHQQKDLENLLPYARIISQVEGYNLSLPAPLARSY